MDFKVAFSLTEVEIPPDDEPPNKPKMGEVPPEDAPEHFKNKVNKTKSCTIFIFFSCRRKYF
jgi:hypothetical protein